MGDVPAGVIFDMDDVLCRYRFPLRLARLSQMTGVPAGVIDEVIWKQGFDEEADTGHYPAETYLRLFCERIGAPLTRGQWLEARAASMEPNAEVLDIVRRVKRRAVVALLTNNGPLLEESIDQVFPEVVELFGEHVYFSCSLGARKPDPRVFLLVSGRLGLAPEAVLFVDDNAGYVSGAAAAGLLTHPFQSVAGLRDSLRSLDLLG